MIIAAGVITRYDWQPDLRFMVRLDIYSYTTANYAPDILTSQSFSVEDPEGVVNAGIYSFVRDYITRSVDDGGWGMVFDDAVDTIAVINSYQKAHASTILSSKASVFWELDEDTGTPRADSIGTNHLTEVGTVTREATADGSWAAVFNGDGTSYLSIVGSPELVSGDFDFTIAFWAQANVIGTDHPFFSSRNASDRAVFELWGVGSGDWIQLRVHDGTEVDQYTTTLAWPEVGDIQPWALFVLSYEAAADTFSVRMNLSAPYLIVPTGAIQTDSDRITVGYALGNADIPTTFDGAIRRFEYFPHLLTAEEVLILFNNGAGQNWPHEEITPSSVPTGTGFRHITDGVEDAAATLVETEHIAPGAVTYAEIQDVSATDQLLGRSTAGAGPVEEIYCTAAGRALLDDATAELQRNTLGLGSIATMSADVLGALASKDTVATADIDPAAVTYPKMQDVSATDRLLGRQTAGAGDVEEIPCTAAGRALLAESSAENQRVVLGLGAMALRPSVATADIDASAITYDEIANGQVYFEKIQDVSATDKLLGRVSAGAGPIEEIFCFAPGRDFLDDGTVAEQRTTLGLGALATKTTVATADIDADAVTYALMQNVSATDKLLGRSTAGAGNVEEIACTAAGRALLDDAAASNQRTTLGLGAVATMTLLEAQNTVYCFLAADDAYSTIAKHDLTDMAFTLLANTNYSIVFHLHTTANAVTVGCQFALTFGGTITYAQFTGQLPGAATTLLWITDTGASPFLFNPTASQGNVAGLVTITGTIEVGASGGTLQLQHGSETATLTTVVRGSWGMCAQQPA